MSAYGKDRELECFERLITKVYPEGAISIVSDTWNLWTVIDEYLPALKEKILDREGTVVIRPDSGDPVEIVCGQSPILRSVPMTSSQKGVIESLWDIFGGHTNSKGYKVLDPRIGCIYGDGITPSVAEAILKRLKEKGFSSSNIVFGVGSFSYQYHTRDSLGWAMKATYCEVDGEARAIYKDPITDDGTKKSHKGLLKVVEVTGAHGKSYAVKENQTWDEFYQPDNALKLVFKDGMLTPDA